MPIRTEGPTPAGGAYAEAYWWDDSGEEVAPGDAVSGEIIEYDVDDLELRRTYVGGEAAAWDTSSSFDAPLELESQDGPKLTWDLWADDFTRPVTTFVDLQGALGWLALDPPALFEAASRFLELPAWGAAPAALKAEVYAWLASHRQE